MSEKSDTPRMTAVAENVRICKSHGKQDTHSKAYRDMYAFSEEQDAFIANLERQLAEAKEEVEWFRNIKINGFDAETESILIKCSGWDKISYASGDTLGSVIAKLSQAILDSQTENKENTK